VTPISSMTGAGFASGESEIGDVRVEIRSVNGRGLSLKMRLSSACNGFEAAIEERVKARIGRGSVLVVAERMGIATSLPDRETLSRVAAEMRELADDLQLAQPTLVEVIQAASSNTRGDSSTSRPLPEKLGGVVDAAIAQLIEHRHNEGLGTVAAITEQLDEFVRLTDVCATRAPFLIEEYRTRVLQRVQDFVAAHVPTPPPAVDLVREVALFADRVDVAEELQRLRAHTDETRSLLHKGGEVGRRLEFLLQELLRETNTLGSKSPDTEVAHTVVAMKSSIATIKEQVANLE
jgi:uncharacterized protein (TIGR00255 family)